MKISPLNFGTLMPRKLAIEQIRWERFATDLHESCPNCGSDQGRWKNRVNETFLECIECGWEWDPMEKQTQGAEPIDLFDPVYHVSPRKNRESIELQGLLRNKEGVFLDDDPQKWVRSDGEWDLWEIDPIDLDIYKWSDDDGYYTLDDIPLEKIQRVEW